MPVWFANAIVFIIALIMITGLFGLIVPIFPGNVVIWVASLIYGLLMGFGSLGWWMFALITILMIIATLIDNVLMGAKARMMGAAWYEIFLALLGGIIGTFLFPPFGGLVASPLILFGLEYWRLKDYTRALNTVRGLLIGWGLAFAARFGLGLIMVALWAVWAFA